MVFLLVLLQFASFNPELGQVIALHDTGNVLMRVTARGCIGDTVTPASGNIINGFKYPRTGSNWLYFGGFAIGNSMTYVADGHYAPGGIVSRDFKVVDSLNRVFLHGDQEWECTYNDSGDPTPHSLKIKQYSLGSPDPLYDDGIIMQFTATNMGSSPVVDLYAGLFFDFDMGANLTGCGSDTIGRSIWMRQNTTDNPTIGIKILNPPSWANVSAIDHDSFVYPLQGSPDSIKYKFLAGIIKKFTTTRYYDWSIMASIGPFTLEPGDDYSFAFAVLGGASQSDFYANAESLQSYYDHQIQGISENNLPKVNLPSLQLSSRNPVKDNGSIKLQISEKGKVVLNLYDALGRYVNTLWRGAGPCDENIRLNTKNLSSGLYFLQLNTSNASKTLKVIISK